MSETLRELQDRIYVLRAAMNARTGQREIDVNPKYKREVYALEVHLAERTKAEAPGPQINHQQLATMNRADLNLIDRVSAAKNPETGKRLVDENPKQREILYNARVQVMAGTPLSETTKANTLKTLEGAS